jgi:hypothetical protein
VLIRNAPRCVFWILGKAKLPAVSPGRKALAIVMVASTGQILAWFHCQSNVDLVHELSPTNGLVSNGYEIMLATGKR